MNICSPLAALAVIATLTSTAQAADYSVSRSVTISNPNGDAWNVIGDFCDVDDWHPAITTCALKSKDGAIHRLLTLGNGAQILEKLIAVEPGLSYTYAIVESPLPVENYVSTISITGGDTATVAWSGRFSSDDPGMEAVIGDIYDQGLAAIAARFSQ